MVYDTGLKILPDIVDEIAAGLIATGLWWNADSTWNTTTKTGDNARRALAYGIAGGAGFGDTALSANASIGATSLSVTDETNFNAGDIIVIGTGATAEVRTVQSVSTGVVVVTVGINTARTTGDLVKELQLEMFLSLECLNTTNGYTVWGGYNAKGLRVTFSNGFNPSTHMWSGTNYTSFIQFEMHGGNVTADLAVIKINYVLWYEAAGFVLMGTPEAHADNTQQTFFCVIERNTNKEYADGYTNWFCYNVTNIYNFHGTGYNDNYACHNVMRPWVFKTPEETWNSYNYNSTVLAGINAGIDFPTVGSIYAFRSVANSKVYFFKPVYQNARNATVPIVESELFFPWTESLGIGDGDIIALGTGTKQYIAKVMTGPDGSLRLAFAIKYQD
jgi:hypothetical protein